MRNEEEKREFEDQQEKRVIPKNRGEKERKEMERRR